MNKLLSPQKVEEMKTLAESVLASVPKQEDSLKLLISIAEKHGIKIMQSELYEIAGALRKEGDEWIIYVNESDSMQRKVFTIAHELGHFFAHKELCDEFIDGQFISRDTVEKYAQQELEANEFAGNLIMPEARIRELATGEVTSDVIKSLSKTFGVSTIAMRVRLQNLGYATNAEQQDSK